VLDPILFAYKRV